MPSKELFQCGKRSSFALIMKEGKVISTGMNYRKNNVPCKRSSMLFGEGYEHCKNECEILGHAEEIACKLAGEEAKGGVLYLIGRSYACDNCFKTMRNHGIKQLIICDTALSIFL